MLKPIYDRKYDKTHKPTYEIDDSNFRPESDFRSESDTEIRYGSESDSELKMTQDNSNRDNSNRNMKIINKKFDIPADALDYFYNCKYFSQNCNLHIKLTKETPWFPKDIYMAKDMAKSWTTSLKERNKMFAKCRIIIMFDFNVRAIDFSIKN
jgi:hypothetical protein